MKLKGKYLGFLCAPVQFKSIFDSLATLSSAFFAGSLFGCGNLSFKGI